MSGRKPDADTIDVDSEMKTISDDNELGGGGRVEQGGNLHQRTWAHTFCLHTH